MGDWDWQRVDTSRVQTRLWNRSDPELGLLGFATRQDRDRFSDGGQGPFRRVVADDGRTIIQGEGFRQMVRRLAYDAGLTPPHPIKDTTK